MITLFFVVASHLISLYHQIQVLTTYVLFPLCVYLFLPPPHRHPPLLFSYIMFSLMSSNHISLSLSTLSISIHQFTLFTSLSFYLSLLSSFVLFVLVPLFMKILFYRTSIRYSSSSVASFSIKIIFYSHIFFNFFLILFFII